MRRIHVYFFLGMLFGSKDISWGTSLKKVPADVYWMKIISEISPQTEKRFSPFFDWFFLEGTHFLVYEQGDTNKAFFPKTTRKPIPIWLKQRRNGSNERCSSEEGKRYVYEGRNESGSAIISIAEFHKKGGWNFYERGMDGYDDRNISGCSLSMDGNYLALTGRYGSHGLEVLDLSERCKNYCPLWKKPWKKSLLGFRLTPSGNQLLIFSPEGAYHVAAKAAKIEQKFSFYSQIQKDLNRSVRTISGKTYTMYRVAIIDPEGRYVALLDEPEGGDTPLELNQVQLRDFKTGVLLSTLDGISGRIQRAKFSWDGRYLALSTNTGKIFVVEINQSK